MLPTQNSDEKRLLNEHAYWSMFNASRVSELYNVMATSAVEGRRTSGEKRNLGVMSHNLCVNRI